MKGKLIAVGGVLATAATFCAMATPAEAANRCDLSVGDRTHTLRITPWGVHAGKRDAKACQAKEKFEDDDDEFEDDDEGDEAEFGGWNNGYGPGYGWDNGYGAARQGDWNGYNWPGTWYGQE
ncbi:hypothetical protein AB0K18_31095 [Nonomuraea sp. NPDC049421]|uniref:hypothetical protein n=1 Tax=Nonomuraea sp. NPDC049421 TaxID=3155275 RepID=UPI0034425F9C